MIKTATAKEALQMLREGKEVYYFDTESKKIAPLEKVFESVPGVYLVEALAEPIEITIPTAEPKEKKKPGPELTIDLGKVKALRRAGWTMTKIADEMGVSVTAISYHLKRMESEGSNDKEETGN